MLVEKEEGGGEEGGIGERLDGACYGGRGTLTKSSGLDAHGRDESETIAVGGGESRISHL